MVKEKFREHALGSLNKDKLLEQRGFKERKLDGMVSHREKAKGPTGISPK